MLHLYVLFFCTGGFQLDFIAEGDIGTLEVNRLVLAINLDRHSEKELQPTVPDIVLAQHKAFHPWRASEDEVLSVVPIVRFIRERPALKTLVSLMYSVSNLQCPVDVYMSLPQYCMLNLQRETCYRPLLHVTTH